MFNKLATQMKKVFWVRLFLGKLGILVMQTLYCNFLQSEAVNQITKGFLLAFRKRLIKEARKLPAGLQPTVRLPLIAN